MKVKQLIEAFEECGPNEEVFITVMTRHGDSVLIDIQCIIIEPDGNLIITDRCDVSMDYGENYN